MPWIAEAQMILQISERFRKFRLYSFVGFCDWGLQRRQSPEKEQIGRITLDPADVRTIQKIRFCVRHVMCSAVE